MDFKFWDKYSSSFSTPKEDQEIDYYEIKSKHQEYFEIASKIALKSVGTEEADVMHAEETFDGNLWGLEGNDELFGDDRNNVIYGGLDSDTCRGGDGDDRIYGQEGRDYLVTGDGNDNLYGGVDNDVLLGNGTGKNTYNGGLGIDAVILQRYDNQNPDEVWEFMDIGDRVFLQGDMIDVVGGIASVETTLWDGNAQIPIRDARGEFYQSTEVKNADGHTLFFIEGPTENGITIGWNAEGMEVIGNDGDWNGAKFVHTERLTGIQQWGDQNFWI